SDLVRELLSRIPRRRLPEVVYIGPDERSRRRHQPLALGAPRLSDYLLVEFLGSVRTSHPQIKRHLTCLLACLREQVARPLGTAREATHAEENSNQETVASSQEDTGQVEATSCCRGSTKAVRVVTANLRMEGQRRNCGGRTEVEDQA